ncbi:MAG: glycerol dehydrogenase [candidate division NC10 bacterium]|nr:glycerol dehydrogenase [candidate division NC10 bacterium]
MGEGLPYAFAAPGTYLQGPGVLESVGVHVARLGRRAFGIVDPVIRSQIEPALLAACAAEGIVWHHQVFLGECTEAAVDRMAAAARDVKPEVVIAAGGGKALDTGKLVAEDLGVPSVMIPTIVATDAPTSRVAVLYTEEHAQLRVVRLRANPRLIVVDTAIVLRAPIRFLVAGMGDAIATWPEARACAAAGGRTPVGGRPTRAALALAELCYRTILAHGRQARDDAAAGRLTEAFEAIVEANTLLSGLGFESGGLAAAHSLYAGLSALPTPTPFLHGEKVAFGVVVQSVLEDWPKDRRLELLEFYRDVGLPDTLAAIGLGAATTAELRQAAEIACRPGSHMHNVRPPVDVEGLTGVLERLRA